MPANTYLANDRIHADTPYDEGFVSELKSNVPSQYREWDGQEWIIHPDYSEELHRLINKYYQHDGFDLDKGNLGETPSAMDIWYDGYHFRSKTEARWAYFFNQIMNENNWRYEPEMYPVAGKQYLPDFYLPGHKLYIEIKGERPKARAQKYAQVLSEKTYPVAILVGPPYKVLNQDSVVYETGRERWNIGICSEPGTAFEITNGEDGPLNPGVEEALKKTKGKRFT